MKLLYIFRKGSILKWLCSMKEKNNGSLQWPHEGTDTGKTLQWKDTWRRPEARGWWRRGWGGRRTSIFFDWSRLKGNSEDRRDSPDVGPIWNDALGPALVYRRVAWSVRSWNSPGPGPQFKWRLETQYFHCRMAGLRNMEHFHPWWRLSEGHCVAWWRWHYADDELTSFIKATEYLGSHGSCLWEYWVRLCNCRFVCDRFYISVLDDGAWKLNFGLGVSANR